MKISIIIPIYNVDQYLHEGLTSVINQSYKDLDIVCINDGSTDKSLQIVNGFAQHDNRIHVISQENQGTYIARQVGVAAAVGDYILFFDPDDQLEPNACEQLASFIEQNQTDIIQYGVNIDSDIEDTSSIKWFDRYFNSDVGCLNSREAIWNSCYVEQKISWNLIGKVVKTAVAKQAFKMQGRSCFSTLTDYFATFYIYTYAQSYQCFAERLYNYRFGVGVSTKKDVTIEDFKKSIRNFKGLADLNKFADSHTQLLGAVGCDIAKRVMREYTINSALHFALNRLPRETDVAEWFGLLAKEIDANDILRQIIRNLNHANDALANNHNAFAEENKLMQQKLQRISMKNNRHLKQLRILGVFCLLFFLLFLLTICIYHFSVKG